MSIQSLRPVERKRGRKEERRVKNIGPPDGVERRNTFSDRRSGNNSQYVTFFLGDHFFGVEVEKVQEVFQAKEMTQVPLAPPAIAGLINLRGHIIITIDLRKRLGIKKGTSQSEKMSIVVRTGDGQVNLLVDRIGGVIDVLSDLFEETPSTLDTRLREVIKGIYKLKGRLLLALDTDLITKIDEGSVL